MGYNCHSYRSAIFTNTIFTHQILEPFYSEIGPDSQALSVHNATQFSNDVEITSPRCSHWIGTCIYIILTLLRFLTANVICFLFNLRNYSVAVVETLIYVDTEHKTQHKAQAQHKYHTAYALSMQRQKLTARRITIHRGNTKQL